VINISATNRGAKRVESDFYATPMSVIHNFLNHYKIKDGSILEPSAGNGNFIKALREKGYDNTITAIELRDEHESLVKSGADFSVISDFLEYDATGMNFNTIIGNPPYGLAQEFLEKCFEIANKDTEIIMLLRTAFLESKKRYNFWQKHPVNGLYVLSQRPSFTGKGTDATSYSFFIWNNSEKQEIKVI
jgi:predicted RNA methylase